MWTIKRFNELTVDELHAIYKLRVKVFVVEQNCAYPDVDDLDKDAIHVFNEGIKAYARIIPGKDFIQIGRIVVEPDFRREGYGHAVLSQAIDYCQKNYSNIDIRVQAQAYLEDFYISFGFKSQSDVYLEDNIPHIDMVKVTAQDE